MQDSILKRFGISMEGNLLRKFDLLVKQKAMKIVLKPFEILSVMHLFNNHGKMMNKLLQEVFYYSITIINEIY